jgi:hypothetical protein
MILPFRILQFSKSLGPYEQQPAVKVAAAGVREGQTTGRERSPPLSQFNDGVPWHPGQGNF